MTDDELIPLLCARALSTGAAAPVSPSELANAESVVGFSFTPLLRRVLLEVCNGGLFGLFGLPSTGRVLDADASILGVRKELLDPSGSAQAFLRDAAPFIDLGCAQWLWVDRDGMILSMVAGALYRVPLTFSDWLGAELAGGAHDLIFARGPDRFGVNPFTKERTVFKSYVPRGQKLWELARDES